ncbi:alpha/beta fold hydrolase [Sphingobacterium haloxyli]|uniref:Alpha/beta hydrolase n=1 Tax=Sphingobacterium haloxyli TaxID=2100533 RepID=A0A2S9J5U5_9SPHI|nr:alpha/beta fold hydrolase [Sphingobacterium haloxyli]PRD48109.1 alpha/beta hydrolase [Sphingobacterium haloxyli]
MNSQKKIFTWCLFLFLFLFVPDSAFAQNTLDRQNQYLNEILKINIEQRFRANTRRVSVQDSTWKDWLHRTGELPPDFSKMRSIPMLPEPLVQYKDGKEVPITTEKEWEKKREWIKSEYQKWISGHAPPAPGNVLAEILKDTFAEGGNRVQVIRLSFGPQHKAKMTVELLIPNGEGPFPVFMTQWNHRDWAQLAVKRGYIGCVYAGADSKDDTDSYMFLYPEYDFSALMRRAWGASRVVDYLMMRAEVNKQQIAITGHSRNGKQSLWAASFDERIAAVISSSSSTGGDAPWRYGDPQYASETLDYVTAWNAHWFHPRLKFFSGREDKLPVDQNLLGALIAPRPLLYHYSLVEPGLNSWSNEQNYYSVKKVYDFLGVPDNIGVLTRMGAHAVAARDVEQTIDFLDIHFKRIPLKWTNNLYYTYDYEKWKENHPNNQENAKQVSLVSLKENYSTIEDFNQDKRKILTNLNWILGEEPPSVRAANVGTWNNPRRDWIEKINPVPVVKGAKEIYLGPYSATGDHVPGVLYCPTDEDGVLKTRSNGKLPVIVYSHQYAHSTGFVKGYDKTGSRGTKELFESLVKRGFAVLAIDMYGFGTRIWEAKNFYLRYPNWSKMGKMIRDVKGCIDAIEDLDYLDEDHVYLLGNTIGGSVSLMTAALDDRVAGIATVAAFSPWRSSDSQYESLRTYSHLHGFIPRLGTFADNPQNTPIDFGEIIAAVAPKPILILTPDLDRYTDIQALKKMMNPVHQVYSLYGKQDQLTVAYPAGEINRMTVEMYGEIGAFFGGLYEVRQRSK